MFYFFEERREVKGKEKEELFKMLMNEIVPLREKISYELDSHGFPCKGNKVRKELADDWTLADYWRNERFVLSSQEIVAEFEEIPQKVITQGHHVKTLLRITKRKNTATFTFKELCYLFKEFGYIEREKNNIWEELYKKDKEFIRKHSKNYGWKEEQDDSN